MEDRIERINLLIKYLGLTKNSLALNSGLAPSNLNKMLLGEQSITDKTLEPLCVRYAGGYGKSLRCRGRVKVYLRR